MLGGGAITLRCGVDADGNWISLEATERTERIALPRWIGGVGGMELVVSADERHAALFIYSGQSSQGYELFALEPSLSHLGGLPETRGKSTGPLFSPGGDWLVSLIDVERCVRGTGDHFETVQDDSATDRIIVDWAQLYVQRVPHGDVCCVEVGVEVPRALEVEEVLDWDAYDAVSFDGDDIAVLRMPWGELLPVPLPPTGPITSRGFVTRGGLPR